MFPKEEGWREVGKDEIAKRCNIYVMEIAYIGMNDATVYEMKK